MHERSYLDGVLSTHFNECSIAAADASWIAHDTVSKDRSLAIDLQPVGLYESERLEKQELWNIREVSIDHDSVVGGEVLLALASCPRSDRPVTLVAIFNHDMMLPVATFAPRENGQCSNVQLGQEIAEDNLIVTEQDARAHYVDQIRALLQEGSKYGGELNLIEDLVKTELEKYRSGIDCAFDSVVCRIVDDYFHPDRAKEHSIEEISLLNDETRGDMVRKYLTTDLELMRDGTEEGSLYGGGLRLVLARQAVNRSNDRKKAAKKLLEPNETIGSTQLIAMVRGNVGVRLMQFSERGVVTLADFDQSAGKEILGQAMEALQIDREDSRRNIKSITECITRAYELANKKEREVYVNAESRELVIAKPYRVARCFSRRHKRYKHTARGVITIRKNGGLDKSRKVPITAIPKRNLVDLRPNDVKRFGYEYVVAECLPGLPSDRSYSEKAFSALNGLLGMLNVKQKLEEFLDPGDAPAEKLIRQLGSLVTSGHVRFSGILEDRTVGKIRTNVNTDVVITRGDKHYRVVVKARPMSSRGSALVTIIDEKLRLDMKNEVEEAKIKEIAEFIGAICTPENLAGSK